MLLLFDTARALLAAGASATVGREEYQLPAGFAVGPESLDSLSHLLESKAGGMYL